MRPIPADEHWELRKQADAGWEQQIRRDEHLAHWMQADAHWAQQMAAAAYLEPWTVGGGVVQRNQEGQTLQTLTVP